MAKILPEFMTGGPPATWRKGATLLSWKTMSQNQAGPDWGRSVGAVVAGFICTALLSVGTDAFMHARGIFPPPGEAMSDGLFALASVYRLVFTVLGGYMTAALAPRAPMIHVVILGTIGALAATAGAVSTWNAGPEFGPHWYPVLLVVTALPCVWAGGVLRMRRQRAM